MAAIIPQTPTIPLDIRADLADPLTPWKVSQKLVDQLQPSPNNLYRKVRILPSDTEWRFIWRYFHFQKPLRFTIKQVHFVYERHQQSAFELNLSSIEREATSFPPTWNKESRTQQRSQAIQRWAMAAQIFSPFNSQEADGRSRVWTRTKILPLWHGTSEPVCDSICTSGFVYFGKNTIPGGDGGAPVSTDDGYFGSGLYFTNSARYAADIYSKGHLLLGWVSMREPFPVVGDPKQVDMSILRGRGAYKNYNAHYVPVAPIDPQDPYCAEYHPAQENQPPTCDEYVVFHKSQALPQYWVELELELPYINIPNQTPQIVSELTTHLMRILQNPDIDRDQKLRNLLNKQLTALYKLPSDDDLSDEQIAFYEQIINLISPQGAVNKVFRNQILNLAAIKPVLAQEEKDREEPYLLPPQPLQPPPPPQPLQKPNILPDPLKKEKEDLLAAIAKNWRVLEHASQQLKGDREIVLAAVRRNGKALKYASEELKGDREIVLAAVSQNGRALEYASEELKGDREVVLSAVSQNGLLLMYASEVLKGNRKVVLVALSQNGAALAYASDGLKVTREIVLAAVSQNGVALNYTNYQLKRDREVVLAAVKTNELALKYASEDLKEDRKVVLAAVTKSISAFRYAHQWLKEDREFMLAAVKKLGLNFAYAYDSRLLRDKEFMLTCNSMR